MAKRKTSAWTLIKTRALCAKCHSNTDMLCKLKTDRPAFYICFLCGSVAELGVGPVIRTQGEMVVYLAKGAR